LYDDDYYDDVVVVDVADTANDDDAHTSIVASPASADFVVVNIVDVPMMISLMSL